MISLVLLFVGFVEQMTDRATNGSSMLLFCSTRSNGIYSRLEISGICSEELRFYDCDKELVARVKAMVDASNRPPYFVDDSYFKPYRRGTRTHTLLVSIPSRTVRRSLRSVKAASEEYDDAPFHLEMAVSIVYVYDSDDDERDEYGSIWKMLVHFSCPEVNEQFLEERAVSLQVSRIQYNGMQPFVSSCIPFKSSEFQIFGIKIPIRKVTLPRSVLVSFSPLLNTMSDPTAMVVFFFHLSLTSVQPQGTPIFLVVGFPALPDLFRRRDCKPMQCINGTQATKVRLRSVAEVSYFGNISRFCFCCNYCAAS